MLVPVEYIATYRSLVDYTEGDHHQANCGDCKYCCGIENLFTGTINEHLCQRENYWFSVDALTGSCPYYEV